MRASDEDYVESFLGDTERLAPLVDRSKVRKVVAELRALKMRGGRLFLIGNGGGAAHASHGANDARNLLGIEAYCASDNQADLTALINDGSWVEAYANWLKSSRLGKRDLLFVFSVGGGDLARRISANIARSVQYARSIGAPVCGLVGRDGGFVGQASEAVVVIPVVDEDKVTCHTEGFQSVIWHLLVSHPEIQASMPKWESL